MPVRDPVDVMRSGTDSDLSRRYQSLANALADRYRVERQLGEGGMATVYLAHDVRHDRKVALKVLKPELAAVLGAERFIVEIKTTAALQHPHILPLFDSGTAEGFLYYVMPYIEGETLRAKLDRETQLGVDEAVRLTTQVADALDYAHRHGVIHRDIKPENILLHDGRPVVADFGIALAVSAAAGGRMTETGLSLGTPHYMSPEQATAEKELSGRSDIYSLASVLYEMLTGHPPHTGASAQQIIMKIIAEPAQPVTKFRKSVAPHIAFAVEKALEKLPADRFETAAAFAAALSDASFTSSLRHPGAAAATVQPGWRERVAIPALVVIGALAAAVALLLSRDAPREPLSRYYVDFPEGRRLGGRMFSPIAVSPDGSKLVYVGENSRLFVLSRDQLDPVEMAGTEGAFNPFFSPDGSRVGFMSGSPGAADIKIVSLAGGPPTTVVSASAGGPGAAWGFDGFIYFDAPGVGPMLRVPETGGVPEVVSVRDSAGGELQHNWPDPFPNGRGVLMVVDRTGPGIQISPANEIAVLDLETRTHRVLAKGIYAKYAKSGHVLYVTSTGTLMAVPFDIDRLEATGPPVSLLEGVTIRRGGGGVVLTISETGTLWYGAGAVFGEVDALWVSRAGEVSEVEKGLTGSFASLALSPDGERLALSILDATGEQIWVKRMAAGGPLSKLTFDGVNGSPRWHPDGKQILFVARFSQTRNVRAVRADGGSASPEDLMRTDGRAYFADWSADGKWLVYEWAGMLGVGRDIAAIRVGVDSAPLMLAGAPFVEGRPSVSPDGRWLLYHASQTGRSEVYVRPFPNAAQGLYQISTGGGSNPRWSRDGREIFYVNGNIELARVAIVGNSNTFEFGDQRVLFSLRNVVDWDIAPDARRFIVLRERQDAPRNSLVVVENFFEELNAKVPR